MQRQRRFIQITLKLNPCCIDELLVFRRMLHWMLIEMRRCTQRPQVQIHNPIRLRQQPCRFRWRFFTEINRPGQQQQDDKHNGDGKFRAPVGHRMGFPLFREAAVLIFSPARFSRTSRLVSPILPALCGPER